MPQHLLSGFCKKEGMAKNMATTPECLGLFKVGNEGMEMKMEVTTPRG